MNTINIFIKCNKNIGIFTSANTSENLNVFITLDENIYGIYEKKKEANFLFILLFSCFRASDIITDIAKQK